MQNLEKNLENIGIAGKEKDIYLAVLKFKRATVMQLAKEANIKRTTVYHCLDALIEKGLIIKSVKDDKKFYVAEDPMISFKTLLEEKKNTINSLIPDLKNIFGQGAYEPEIRIYRNKNGLQKMMNDILTAKEKKSRYYISHYNQEDLVGEKFMDEFVKNRVAAGIKSYSLRSFKYKPPREKSTTNTQRKLEVKFISENFFIKPYMCIYDDKVIMLSSKEERLGFLIKSKEFAEAQKQIFDMVWNSVAI